MKQLKKDLQAVSKSVKQLTLRTEKIAKKLEKLEKPKPVKKSKAKVKAKARPKVTKKPVKVSAAATVLAIIERSRKGVAIATLSKKTGFDSRKIGYIVQRFRKEGKIENSGKGIYVKT
jgi:predicted transcriptional regulator